MKNLIIDFPVKYFHPLLKFIIVVGLLARELSDGEAWAQAGLCCVAVARCEQTLVNPATEVSAITQAARFFLKVNEIS